MEDREIRLQKYLASAGVASRRAAEGLITAGRVAVNGNTVTVLGVKVDPRRDKVTVDGKPIADRQAMLYFALNKPRGYVSTASDPEGRPTVLDLVPTQARLYPVGRLDADSEGLILLSNDGDLAYRITHPSHQIDKEYNVVVEGRPSEAQLQQLRDGIEIEEDGSRTAPAQIMIIKWMRDAMWLRVVIREGRKRQIRRMFDAIGYPVLHLQRIRIGSLRLGTLPLGEYRSLTKQEVAELRRPNVPRKHYRD
jgi:pseudouridine synthase